MAQPEGVKRVKFHPVHDLVGPIFDPRTVKHCNL